MNWKPSRSKIIFISIPTVIASFFLGFFTLSCIGCRISIVDSSSGIGCPVIASVTGNDYAIIVTEPTPSGFSDLKKALEVVDHFRIKKGMIINKFDLNNKFTEKICSFADDN